MVKEFVGIEGDRDEIWFQTHPYWPVRAHEESTNEVGSPNQLRWSFCQYSITNL